MAVPKAPSLPKQQLFILCICRFAEPLVLTSVFPYLPEMMESFGIPPEDVAFNAGMTSLAFSLAQACTSIQWGRGSDRFGRKPMILAGLSCAMATSLLFGFSQNLPWAITARALAGASNGNVGILRTTVAELVPHKSLQPQAFAIMPMIWAIGSLFGPVMGGMLAAPARELPGLFGGNAFFEKFKFALPNIVASVFFSIGLIMGILFLKETLETKRHKKDYGIVLGQMITRGCRGERIKLAESPAIDIENVPTSPQLARRHSLKLASAPSWAEVFSVQSSLNILSYTILAFHAVTFDQLVPVFLHYPVQDHGRDTGNVQYPFKFSGGLGLETGRIGLLFSLMAVVGIIAQFGVFPPVTRRFGSLRCFQVVTFLFPFLYIAVPYVVLLPTDRDRQIAIFALMFCKSIMSTFAFPCTTILLTNSASSVRILGTLNGVAVATSALGRASGPFIGGGMFTWGVHRGFVIVPWFILGFFAVLGHISTWWLLELDGPSARPAPTAITDSDTEQPEDEIVLLPGNDNEANAGQATGLMINNEDDLRHRADEDGGRPYIEPEDDDDDPLNEHSPLLRATSLKRTVSDNSINFGGTSITKHPAGGRTGTEE